MRTVTWVSAPPPASLDGKDAVENIEKHKN